MLYAHNQESNKVNSILLFLNLIIDGENKYKSYVDAIINDAIDLVTGEKTIYDINKDNFLVITKLQEYGQDTIKSIRKEKIEIIDYKKIKELLDSTTIYLTQTYHLPS